MKKTIRWEWWEHPLGGGVEYTDESEKEKPDDWDADDGDLRLVRPIVPTPAGAIPVNIYGSLTKAFNFWMAHTNFDITSEIQDLIKVVPGVETLDILTRYRMRIGFGKVFNAYEVKQAIQKACGVDIIEEEIALSLDPEIEERLDSLRRKVSSKYKYWAIFLLPNAEIAVTHDEDYQAYLSKLSLYVETQELIGGIIYSCEDK